MNVLRRFGFPLRLTGARLFRGGGRFVLPALGVAAASGALAAVLTASAVAQDRSVARAVARIPPADRTVSAVWGGVASADTAWPALDARVGRALREFGGQPVRAMLFRETAYAGRLVDLGAVDGLARFVRLRSGRLPRGCRPARCEVLHLGGPSGLPTIPGLRLVQVGTADLASTVPLGDLVTAATYATVLGTARRYHTVGAPQFLLAEGVRGLATAAALAPTYRSYAWRLPLAATRTHPWTVASLGAAADRTRARLQTESFAFDVAAPVEQLQAAARDARVAGRRLLVVGGEAAALLLAFAVLAALGLRRDVEAHRRRLTWFGARRWQLATATGGEAVAVVAGGALAGWVIGAGVGLAVAARAGAPAWEVARHGALSGTALAWALAAAAAATAALVLTLRSASLPLGGVTLTPVDVAAVGAAVAVVVSLARGATDADALAGGGGAAATLLLLPALIAFVVAVAAGRLLAPGLRLLERFAREGPVPLRLASLSLARASGRAAVVVAFLVVSLGLAVFAETYRSTLSRGEADQAAFAAPLDFLASEDLDRLVPVTAVGVARFPRHAVPVLRASGDVPRGEGFTLVALPANDLRRVSLRGDDAPLGRDELAARLAPDGSVAVRGVRLPAGRVLALPVGVRGDDVRISATLVGRDGAARTVVLRGARVRRAAVPRGARLLVSLTLDLLGTGLHGVPNGGANAAPVARGTLRVGTLRVDGRRVGDLGGWIGEGGVTGTAPRVRYVVTGERVARLRAPQPTDGRPIPVAATPGVAAAAGPSGVLPIRVLDRELRARVVATLRRFPTVDGEAVLADRQTVATALTAVEPGAVGTNEVWVDAEGRQPAVAAALARPPFSVLHVTSRARVERELRTDPLARGALLTLAAAAVAALVLALAGLALAATADLRDERGELFDLEAQGLEPEGLRLHLRLRSALAAAVGVAGGLATGAGLAALTVAVVRVTAGAARPVPPLVLALDWPVLLLGAAAYALAAAAVVVAVTARAFRADVAGRYAEVAA